MKPVAARILLVEDDPVSRAFLAAALAAVPARVDAAASGAEALRRAGAGGGHDLWLVDAHLPDGDGAALLGRLRARAPGVPAIAHTASDDAGAAQALRDAGFAEVLRKPITVHGLRKAVRAALRHASASASAAAVAEPAPHWNDAVAMSALRNDSGHVGALRMLFLGELPAQRDAILAALADGDRESATAVLHRLRASCGFVGAVQLEAAVCALQREPASAGALQDFIRDVESLLA